MNVFDCCMSGIVLDTLYVLPNIVFPIKNYYTMRKKLRQPEIRKLPEQEWDSGKYLLFWFFNQWFSRPIDSFLCSETGSHYANLCLDLNFWPSSSEYNYSPISTPSLLLKSSWIWCFLVLLCHAWAPTPSLPWRKFNKTKHTHFGREITTEELFLWLKKGTESCLWKAWIVPGETVGSVCLLNR